MKHWFISDLHIKDINERNGNTLLRFFFYLNQNPKEHKVYLLGDIFDFWLSDGRAFLKHYQFLIDQIKKFKNAGGEIVYFEGNHDFHIDVFWTRQLGIQVFDDEAFFDIDGLKVRCEHGDYINPDDHKYIAYRELVREPWVEWIAHALPGFFWKWFGENQSQKSRKKTSHYSRNNAVELRAMIQAYAMRIHNAEPFDVLVTGHMHIFDDYTFQSNSGPVRSINLGTWLDCPRALLIENKSIKIIDIMSLISPP